MNNSPNIIWKFKKQPVLGTNRSNKSRKNYYCNGGYLDYILRPDAIFNLDIDDEEIMNLNNLRKNNPSAYEKQLEAYNTDGKTTGLYGKNGVMSLEEVKDIRKEMNKLDTNQHLWDTFVSFSEDFTIKNNINSPKRFHNAIKTELNNFFKANHFIPDKMSWGYANHTNTDNNHVHLFFYEKEPHLFSKIKKEDGKKIINKDFRKNGNFKISDRKIFTDGMALKIESSNYDFNKMRENKRILNIGFNDKLNILEEFLITDWDESKQIFTDIKNQFLKPLDKFSKFSSGLYEKLKSETGNISKIRKMSKNITYGSKWLNNEDRKILDGIVMDFINGDPNVKQMYDNYLVELEKYSESVAKVHSKHEYLKLSEEQRQFEVSPADRQKKDKDWNLEDDVEVIKYQKVQLMNKELKTIDSNGHYNGIIPNFANKILNSMKSNWRNEESANLKINTKIDRSFNPTGSKFNKGFKTKMSYMPRELYKQISTAKRQAQKMAWTIEREIAKEIEAQNERADKENG